MCHIEARLVSTTYPKAGTVFCERQVRLDDGELIRVVEPLRPDGALNPIPLGSRVRITEKSLFVKGLRTISFVGLDAIR
jgi:hypothetical protein